MMTEELWANATLSCLVTASRLQPVLTKPLQVVNLCISSLLSLNLKEVEITVNRLLFASVLFSRNSRGQWSREYKTPRTCLFDGILLIYQVYKQDSREYKTPWISTQ